MRFIGKFVILAAIFVVSFDTFAEAISPFPAVATSADCISGYGRLLTKEEIVVGRHISVKGADGKPIEARIVSVDPKDGVAVLVRPETPGGNYRFLTPDEAKAVFASMDPDKVPRAFKEQGFIDKLLLEWAQPISPNFEITHEAFKESKSEQLQYLLDMGVKLRDSDVTDFYTSYNNEVGAPALRFVSTVKEVTFLPIPGNDTSLSVSPLLHPEMGAKLAELRRAGYRFVVDHTLPFTGAGAYVDPETKVLAIDAFATWRDFIHEFEHFRIDNFIGARAKFLKTLKIGNAEQVLPKEILGQIGEKRLAVLNSYEQRGFPENAYHEKMAVEAELQALGFQRYFAPSSFSSRNYQLSHRMFELVQIRNRTPDQDRELRNAILKRIGNWSAGIAIRRPIATVAGTAAAYYGVRSILLSEKTGDVYIEDEKGSWTHLRSDDRR